MIRVKYHVPMPWGCDVASVAFVFFCFGTYASSYAEKFLLFFDGKFGMLFSLIGLVVLLLISRINGRVDFVDFKFGSCFALFVSTSVLGIACVVFLSIKLQKILGVPSIVYDVSAMTLPILVLQNSFFIIFKAIGHLLHGDKYFLFGFAPTSFGLSVGVILIIWVIARYLKRIVPTFSGC